MSRSVICPLCRAALLSAIMPKIIYRLAYYYNLSSQSSVAIGIKKVA